MKIKSLWCVGFVAVVLLSFPFVSSAELRGSFDRTLQVSGPVDLSVKSGSGSITVRTGSDGTLQVIGKIYSAKARAEENVRYLEDNPPIEQNGNTVRVGEIDRDRSRDISISYELVVPVATQLVSKTGSGSQTIGDIQGPVEVSSGSGSLKVGNISGRVEASAGSGSIEVRAASGGVRADTGSGFDQGLRSGRSFHVVFRKRERRARAGGPRRCGGQYGLRQYRSERCPWCVERRHRKRRHPRRGLNGRRVGSSLFVGDGHRTFAVRCPVPARREK